MSRRPTLAMYWAASCGGCEVSLLNIGERLLMVDRVFEIVFFPCITDFKHEHVRDLPDGHIDLCLFNGAIRSSDNREMARLLRRKSKVLVAYGSCAHEGCVPALANLTTAAELLTAVYVDSPSTDSCEGRMPRQLTQVPEGELSLPELFDTVLTLDQVEEVDYYIPGCPPEPARIWDVLEGFVASFAGGAELPPKGTVLGGGGAAVCEECPLPRHERQVTGFVRPHELAPEAELCLLDQGLLCMGVATRGGCGALCPKIGMGCRGCYGAPEGVEDQGARALAAVASVVGVGSAHDDESELRQEIEAAMATLVDPVGTFYRFSMAHSQLRRARVRRAQGGEDVSDEADQH